MFLGEFNHNLDSKFRVIVPVKFREDLGESFVITKGYDRCLFIYHLDEWQELLNKIKVLPKSDPFIRRFERLFIGGASVLEPDNQGRVLVPQNLRIYGEIEKELVFVGVSNRIEVWSQEKWNTYNNDSNYLDDELAIKMAELGI